ncbi:MAG: hypothetical protein ACM3ZA_08130 [Bacillota bacterium]
MILFEALKSDNAIYVVLLVNGIPVATLELKAYSAAAEPADPPGHRVHRRHASLGGIPGTRRGIRIRLSQAR